MALTDVFKIGFESDNLKQFESELKKNEQELDKYEKKVKECEEALKDLEKQGKKDSEEYKKISDEMTDAKAKADSFTASIKKMKGQSEYSLLSLKKNFTALTKNIAGLATVTMAVKKSMKFYEEAQQLDFLAQKSGVAVEAIQRLGNAVQAYGGTTEGAGGTLETLRIHRTELKKGTASDEVKKYGSLFEDDPEQTLMNIAYQMEKMRTEADKWDFADSLGIDEGTTRLLVQGVERYREELKRTEKYKLYTKEDIERMRDYQQIQTDIRMGIQRIQAVIAKTFLPALTKIACVIQKFTDFMAKHEAFARLIGVIMGIAAGLTACSAAAKVLGAILGTVFGAFKIFGILTFLFYMITDFIGFLEGKDSVIGRLWTKWGYDLDRIRDGFEIWAESIKRIWNNLLAVFDRDKEMKNINPIDDIRFNDEMLKKNLTPYQQAKLDNYLLANKKSIKEDLVNAQKRSLKNGDFKTKDFYMSREYEIFQKLREAQKRQKAIKTGKQVIEHYNKNEMNAVPQGAAATYNQTQAINTNNNNNITNINNARSKGETKIDKVVINTQASDAAGIWNSLQNAVYGYDDGMLLR